jgi:perosamine synthetase
MHVTTQHFSVSQPALIGREREYVLDCIERNELNWQGSYVKKFEKEFAKFCGVKHAISCSSGTAALHLALLALDVQEGWDVFLPSLTYIATANVVRYCRARPVFCDIDPKTWCIDPQDVERKRADSYSIILPVHLYGVPADLDGLSQFDGFIIEDAAEAHGAFWKTKRVGSVGIIGAFSFYGNKILTCGEGGMVTTDNDDIDSLVRLFRGQGQTKQYYHTVIGYNYRMTNLQAAVGLAQLECYNEHAAARKRIFDVYNSYLSDKFITQCCPYQGVSANWLYSILLPSRRYRDRTMQLLLEKNIETRPFFTPITDQPSYKQATPPVTADIASRGLNLPTYTGLTDEQVSEISTAVMMTVARL